MPRNFRLKVVMHLKVIVFLDAKLRNDNRGPGINLLLQLLQVALSIFKVGFQPRLLNQILEGSHGVVQAVYIRLQVLIILLQKHRVLAEADEFLNHLFLKFSILRVRMQSYQFLVELHCNAQAEDPHTVVHHFLR